MALPHSIEGPERKVRDAVTALGIANSAVETARGSGDEDRMTNAQSDFASKASALESAAQDLKAAATRL